MEFPLLLPGLPTPAATSRTTATTTTTTSVGPAIVFFGLWISTPLGFWTSTTGPAALRQCNLQFDDFIPLRLGLLVVRNGLKLP